MRPALTALVTLFFFGCQTVQVQSGPPRQATPYPAARVALAEPELDLWLEGAGGGVSPQESEQGLEQARAALGAALDGRGFVRGEEASRILVVRAQGVARTESRKSGQTAAIVGIVLVVVAIVVLIVTSNRGSSRGHGPVAAGRPVPPARGGHPGFRPGPYYGPPAPWFGWGFGWGVHVHAPLVAAPYYAPVATPTLEARLPARGYVDGDETEIAFELRDARTGEVVWSRVGRDGIDPRDPRAVRALVDRLIWDQPFAHPVPGAPAPQTAPEPAPQSQPQPPPPARPPPPKAETVSL